MELRISAISGAFASVPREMRESPVAMAIYCLPLTPKEIGGAVKPAPMLIFHFISIVSSSKAANVPSAKPEKTRPPAVATVPA